VTQNTILDDPI